MDKKQLKRLRRAKAFRRRLFGTTIVLSGWSFSNISICTSGVEYWLVSLEVFRPVYGVGLLYYQIFDTLQTLNTIVPSDVLKQETKCAEYIYFGEASLVTAGGDSWHPVIKMKQWWHHELLLTAWRLMHAAKTGNQNTRLKSVRMLSALPTLKESDYVQFAQACDARTAIGLARSKDVDLRFFLPPPYSNRLSLKKSLLSDLKHLLIRLNEESEHYCLKYFVAKAFPSLEDSISANEFRVPTRTMSEATLIPLILESLLHHCALEDNAKDLIKVGALPLILDLKKRLRGNIELEAQLANIILLVSKYKEFIQDLYAAGVVGVVAEWAQSHDDRLCVPASCILANLDEDDTQGAKYGEHVFLLHPNYIEAQINKMDVILAHGLLGGVLQTWRQRDVDIDTKPLAILGMAQSSQRKKHKHKSKQFFTPKSVLELVEWDRLGSDYEFVFTDLPINSTDVVTGPYSFPGTTSTVRNYPQHKPFSHCWPRDWFPEDCEKLRILGISYGSRLSDWLASCPAMEKTRKHMVSLSRDTLTDLSTCGVGLRPIFWIAHSMGGLLVKQILTTAWQSNDPVLRSVAENTKGIIFLGTPHLGSPVASLSETARLLVSPSVEVEMLRENSKMLQELQEVFNLYIKDVPVEILSFTEGATTQVTMLKFEIHIVPQDLGDVGVGELFVVPLNHMNICKPDSKNSFIYQKILSIMLPYANSH